MEDLLDKFNSFTVGPTKQEAQEIAKRLFQGERLDLPYSTMYSDTLLVALLSRLQRYMPERTFENNYDGPTLEQVHRDHLGRLYRLEIPNSLKTLLQNLFRRRNIILQLPYSPYQDEAENFPMTEEEKEVIRNYTYLYDTVINYELRSSALDKYTERMVKVLMFLLDRWQKEGATNLQYLYRGTGTEFKPVFLDKGFASRTSNPTVAESFSGDQCCIYVFENSSAPRPFPLARFSHFPNEDEYLNYPAEEYEVVDKFQLFNGDLVNVFLCRYLTRYQPVYVQDITLTKEIRSLYYRFLYLHQQAKQNNLSVVFSSEVGGIIFILTPKSSVNEEKEKLFEISYITVGNPNNSLLVYLFPYWSSPNYRDVVIEEMEKGDMYLHEKFGK